MKDTSAIEIVEVLGHRCLFFVQRYASLAVPAEVARMHAAIFT